MKNGIDGLPDKIGFSSSSSSVEVCENLYILQYVLQWKIDLILSNCAQKNDPLLNYFAGLFSLVMEARNFLAQNAHKDVSCWYSLHHQRNNREIFCVSKFLTPIPPHFFGIQTNSQFSNEIPLPPCSPLPHKNSLRTLSILFITHFGRQKQFM